MPWMDLETVKLSEVRQKKRNIWYHLYVKSLLKNDTNELIYPRDSHTHTHTHTHKKQLTNLKNELMVTGRSGLEG